MQPFVIAPGATAPAWRPAARAGLGAAPALGGLCWAVVAWEARRARRGPRPYDQAHLGDALIGPADQPPVRIAWLGDSLAAGLGADVVDDTPAHLVARRLDRTVELRVLAVPGSRAIHVREEQLPRLGDAVDLVVLCVGANDVASSSPRAQYTEELDRILRDLAPIPTIALSLPDLAMADRMAQPLRSIAGARARWFERARRRVVAAHPHVTSVDIASLPPGVSRRSGRSMLCSDRFHPGADGYRMWAERIATACDHRLAPSPPTSVIASALVG